MLIVGVFLISFLISFSASVYAVTDCLESDDGLSYYTKGTVYQMEGADIIDSTIQDDECSTNGDDVLLEYYCDGLDIKDTLYTCSYGCNNGACDPAPNSCQYYDYDFSPPAGPVSGCGMGFTCCLDTCIACGSGETVCCALDGTSASCYDPSAGEFCLEDGSIRQTDCDDPSDPNYCDGYCDFCSDGILNDGSSGNMDCGETCVDGGGSCVSQSAETFIEYIPVFEVGEIYHMSGNTNYVSSLSMMFSNSVFCYDNIDNDNDCYVDSADSDCPSTPPPGICIDSDGDGRGVGSICVGTDCDDTDPTIWVNCDTKPPNVKIMINDDDPYTNNPIVTLNLTYSDVGSGIAVDGCMFSDDGSFDTELWEPCVNIKPWTFTGAEGLKTVYVRIKDNKENINSTESDSIFLDTIIPEVSIIINNDSIYTNNATVTLNLTYSATEGSGIAPNGCMFSEDGVFDTELWESCTPIKIWDLVGVDGTKTVHLQIKDNAGNVNSTEADSIILDTLVPTIIVESPFNSSYIYDTQWIMFNVTANDTMSGVVQCEFSINNTLNTTLVNDFGDHYHFFNKSVYVGTYEVIYYCNDSADNMGSVVVDLDVQYDCMLNEDLDPECRTVKYCYLNQWITDSDNSTAACCCISSGYWDNVGLCCDSTDEWLTSVGNGVCTTGVIRGEYLGPTCILPFLPEVETVFTCNEMEINGTKMWWNGTDWTIIAPEYCGCTQNSDCDVSNNELCMDNICLVATAPVIFIENINAIRLGDTTEFIIEITNKMNVSDNVELTLSGIISNWVWFKGKQNMKPHNMVVIVPPQSSKKIIVDVFGGKLGAYTLNVYAQSLLTLKDKTTEASIIIIDLEEVIGAKKVNTPGMSGISFVLVMLFGLLTMYFRKP